MSLGRVKESFFKYILKNDRKNQLSGLDSSDFNIFDYFSQFQEYLKSTEKSDLSLYSIDIKNISEFSEDLSVFLSSDEQNQNSADENSNIGLFGEIFNNNYMTGLFDTNSDGSFTKNELISALTEIGAIDGNRDDVSLDDLAGLSQYINELKSKYQTLSEKQFIDKLVNSIKSLDGNSADLSYDDFKKLGNKNYELGSIINIQDVQETKESDSVKQNVFVNYSDSSTINNINTNRGGSSINTHQSNYTGPSGELKSHELTKSVQTKDGEISNLEKQIIEQNKIKLEATEISSGYFAENKYDEKVQRLNTLISNINNYNSTITSTKAELHETQYDLNAAKVELANLQDPVVFDEYSDDISKLRENLNKQISDLTEKEEQLQNTLKQNETSLKQAESDRTVLENEIATIENNNPNSEANNIISDCNKKIEEMKKKIKTVKSDKTSEENKLNAQRKQEIKDSDVYGLAQAYRQSEFVKFMMDYATNPATKKKYDEWHAKNSGAYCAIFTSDVSEIMYAKVLDKLGINPKSMNTYGDRNSSSQGLSGNQMAMAASAWGEKIQPALSALGLNGSATVNLRGMSNNERADLVRNGKIYPGMTFEYDGGYHTGFIESINKDLSWNTIEGNTAVTYSDGKKESGTVGSHKRDATNSRMYAATDSTIKALIWAYQAGKISIDELRSMTYSAKFAG